MNRNQGRKNNIIVEKPKNTKYVLRRLWDYLYSYKWLVLLAFILTILSSLFALIGPVLTGQSVDVIRAKDQDTIDFKMLFTYCFLMIAFYILSSIFSYILSRIMIKVSKKIVYKMRKDAFAKIQVLPVSYFDINQTGDIISKMSYDIDTINTSLTSDLIQIVTTLITVVGSFIAMVILSPILVLIFVITIPISIIFTRKMMMKTKPLFRKRSRTLGELNGYIEEMITSTKTIHAYNHQDYVLQEFDNYNEIATTSGYEAEYHGSVTGPSVNFINNLSMSLVCIFGAVLNIVTGFSLGKISSFIMYSRKFSGPINEMANILIDLQSAMAASERVFSLIDEKPELADSSDAISLIDTEGTIEFSNVKFGYLLEKTIIHDLSFKALAGKRIAIVGPTGGGKTTIVNLLMRFYDINSGNIYLDNNDIRTIKRADLRLSYAMVLQDTWLFEGTVYDNLAYGKEDATYEEVKQAAKAAKIDGFIERLPNGYDTILNEGGINISKGQKQLLTIARAMLLNTKMLILDEATSNVDTRTEVLIQEAMTNLMKDKTCFIIAHRLSTIQNADHILVIKNGKIIEQGNHLELLQKNGFYKEMYNSQFDY